MASPSPPSSNYCDRKFTPMSIDADITGKGVVANYIGTAGVAVLLIIVYFLVAHDPLQDPFRKTYQATPRSSFRPNAVDVVFLRLLRDAFRRVFRWRRRRVSPRVERIFIKCTLAMGDLQILTGLSILISGYVQLSKDLSAYHWMVIVNLAWFSSLTHLACLTLLRNFLYNRPLQRNTRLLFMGTLAILLVVGLSFTGTYTWVDFEYPPNGVTDYQGPTDMVAIAYPVICQSTLYPVPDKSNLVYMSMLVSIILIAWGFLNRVIKLYHIISVGLCGRLRSWASRQTRRRLRSVFFWCCLNNSPRSLRRTLVYRPLLAVFVAVELGFDWYSSFLLEVGYLAFGFVWGIFRLFAVLEIPTALYKGQYMFPMIFNHEGKQDDWGFGQVVAVLLLTAPLTTIIDHLGHNHTTISSVEMGLWDGTRPPSPPEFQLPRIDDPPSIHEKAKDPDDPDNDWTTRTSTISLATVYIVTLSIIIFSFMMGASVRTDDPDIHFAGARMLLSNFFYLLIPIIVGFVGIFGVVLCSLTIEADLPKRNSCIRWILRRCITAIFICSALFVSLGWNPFPQRPDVPTWSSDGFWWWLFLPSAAGFYILFAITYRVWGLVDINTLPLAH